MLGKMTEDIEKKLLAGAAYSIFFEEVQRHIASSKILERDALTVEERKELSMRFHTIKGGAGFFKMKALSEHAGKLETLLMSPGTQGCFPEARELYKEICEIAKSMPEPVKQAEPK